MSKMEIAKQKFDEGYNCAQSVLFAFANNGIIDKDTALKIATGFGGGIAREGQVCGAFTAGVMLLGLIHGQGINDNEDKKESTYTLVQDFINEFKNKNKSILCKEILNGCDIKTEAGREKFKEKNYHSEICEKCVENSVTIMQKYF